MKRCPTCNQTFDDDSLSFCLNDGASLVSETSSVPTADLQATMMATPPSLGGSSYPPPPPKSGPGSGSFDPPSNPPWATPSAPKISAAPKAAGMNKKLIFGGVGCVALIAIVGIVGIVIMFAFSGASSKMNPYKGELKALAPETIGIYKQVDIDPMRDVDKKHLGNVNDGIGVAYKGSTDDEIRMLICNYSTAKDAEEGLKLFTDDGVTKGWSRSDKGSKKIGWRTVGVRYVLTKDSKIGRVNEKLLPDGATIVRTQASSSTESTQRQFIAWTNGSVIYMVGAGGTKATDFEEVFDKEVK